MRSALFVFLVLALFVFWIVAKTAVVVPQQNAYVVERLGRFSGVLDAGFHILVPFVDAIRYKHLLKEQAMDIPEQVCITKDNVQVAVDGILYLKVMDPERASYGISNYNFAITQLAQTTLRSEIGKIDLDRTFEERTYVNNQVVTEVDKASEARKQQQINEAEGQASAIQAVARATAEGIRSVAEAIRAEGGFEAVQLRVAEQYITQFGHLARTGNSLVIPSNLSDVGSMIALAMNVIQAKGAAPRPAGPPAR
jgi:regulator of protease activity HflC (stomatin/prohibitin superfamily)